MKNHKPIQTSQGYIFRYRPWVTQGSTVTAKHHLLLQIPSNNPGSVSSLCSFKKKPKTIMSAEVMNLV